MLMLMLMPTVVVVVWGWVGGTLGDIYGTWGYLWHLGNKKHDIKNRTDKNWFWFGFAVCFRS